MKIVVCTRTLNEENNILDFITSYHASVDKILIADGGSEDRTWELLEDMAANDPRGKVIARRFTERVEQGGHWRNPHGRHMNFLFDWAFEECGADWVIFDDADCLPNYVVKERMRSMFRMAEHSGFDAIMLYRLYIYLDNGYFPELNKPGQSLWAWNKNAGIRASEKDPFHHQIDNIPPREKQLRYEFPYALLHYSWPTREEVERKVEYYQALYDRPTSFPTEYGGKLEPLPHFAHRNRLPEKDSTG